MSDKFTYNVLVLPDYVNRVGKERVKQMLEEERFRRFDISDLVGGGILLKFKSEYSARSFVYIDPKTGHSPISHSLERVVTYIGKATA